MERYDCLCFVVLHSRSVASVSSDETDNVQRLVEKNQRKPLCQTMINGGPPTLYGLDSKGQDIDLCLYCFVVIMIITFLRPRVYTSCANGVIVLYGGAAFRSYALSGGRRLSIGIATHLGDGQK
jgi:hypothetical protein